MNVIMLLDNCFDPDVRVYKESKYIVDIGNTVEILALDKKNKYIDRPYEEYDKIKIIRFFSRTEKTTKFLSKHTIISKILKPIVYFSWLMKYFINVKKYLKDKRVDILHCHDLTMALFASVILRKYTMVFDMHEYYCDKNNAISNYFIKMGVNIAQKHSKWIIYVNEYQKKDISKNNINKIIELPNYPSKEIFNDISKTESNLLRVSYIGATRDYDSLSKLIKTDLDDKKFKVRIYGYGSEYIRLLELASKNNKKEIMYGAYNGIKDINTIYKNTDILYCVYSNNNINWKKSMPVKSFEAILTMTPIIAMKDSTLGDFVEANNIGFCIKNENENEIKELLTKIQENPNILYEKQNNIKKIAKNFYWEECVKNLNIIYYKKEKTNNEKI